MDVAGESRGFRFMAADCELQSVAMETCSLKRLQPCLQTYATHIPIIKMCLILQSLFKSEKGYKGMIRIKDTKKR